jgi:hypothetical protein
LSVFVELADLLERVEHASHFVIGLRGIRGEDLYQALNCHRINP